MLQVLKKILTAEYNLIWNYNLNKSVFIISNRLFNKIPFKISKFQLKQKKFKLVVKEVLYMF